MTVATVAPRSQYTMTTLVTITAVYDGGSRNIYLADTTMTVGGVQYLGAILYLADIYHGQVDLHRDAYKQSDISLDIAAVRQIGQDDPTHNVLDILNAYSLVGGSINIDVAFNEAGFATSARFRGTIYAIEYAARDLVRVRARNEIVTEQIATKKAVRWLYPATPQTSFNQIVPVLGGSIGFDWNDWMIRRGTSTQTGFSDWAYLCAPTHAAKVPLINGSYLYDTFGKPTVKCGIGKIDNAATTYGMRNVIIRYNDQDHRPCTSDAAATGHLATGEMTEATGQCTIPIADGTEGGGVGQYDALLRGFWCPPPDVEHVNASTQADWDRFDTDEAGQNIPTTWREAFDGNLETYARAPTSGAYLKSKGNQWLTLEYGAMFDGYDYQPSDGNIIYLIALVYTSAAEDVRIGLSYNNNTVFYYGDTSVNGYRLLKMLFANDTAGNNAYIALMDGEGSGPLQMVHDADGIYIGRPTPTPSITLKVYAFGVSMQFPPHAISFLTPKTRRVAGGGRPEIINREMPNFYYSGYASDGAGADPNFATVLMNVMIECTADQPSPITSGAFQSGVSTFGSWALLKTELSDDAAAAETLSVNFTASIIEDTESTLAQILDRACEAAYIHVWRSSLNGLWKARMKGPNPDSNGKILRAQHVVMDSLSVEFQDIDEIRNAIYLDYGWDPWTGKYLYQVYIDNESLKSRNARGGRDTTREGYAQTSQDIYGRRELRLQTKYIRDPSAAWSTVLRRFDLLYKQRLRLKFRTNMWAYDLESMYVFTTDATIDEIMRYPGFVSAGSESEPSWAGRKWQVTRCVESQDGFIDVEAINVDA